MYAVAKKRAQYFENKAEQHRGSTVYNSLTYIADAFIPLLATSQANSGSMSESSLRELAPDIDRKVYHEGELPNICHIVTLCCFWGTTKARAHAFIHILTKTLPLRCQSRSMQHIIWSKAETDPSIIDFVITVFRCFAMGGYNTVQQRPSLAVRAHMYRFFFFTDNMRQDMERWMDENTKKQQVTKNGTVKTKVKYHHENTVTLAIRAFICWSVKQVPSLYSVLSDDCYWKEFESSTARTMEEVMQLMSDNYEARKLDLLDGVESHIKSIKKARKTKIYTPSKGSFLSQMLVNMNKMESSLRAVEGKALRKQLSGQTILMNRDKIGARLALFRQECVSDICITSKLPRTDVELDALIEKNCFPLGVIGMKDAAVRAVETAQQNFLLNQKPKHLKQLLQTLSKWPEDFELFSEFLRQHHIHDNVRLYTLPLHYMEQQLQALIRNHGSSDDLATLTKDYTTISVCLQCGSVHSFIVTPEKSINQTAFGNHGVIVDDEDLRIYCGGKKTSANTASTNVQLENFSPSEMNAILKKIRARSAKQEKADYQMKICNECEITHFNLLGNVLLFFKQLYLLCCNCGARTVYNGGRFYNNMFVCGCCLDRDVKQLVECDLCIASENVNKEKFWTVYENLLDDLATPAVKRDIRVCTKCNKRWLQLAYKKFVECESLEPIAPSLTLSLMMRGNSEKWSVSRGVIITTPKNSR